MNKAQQKKKKQLKEAIFLTMFDTKQTTFSNFNAIEQVITLTIS